MIGISDELLEEYLVNYQVTNTEASDIYQYTPRRNLCVFYYLVYLIC